MTPEARRAKYLLVKLALEDAIDQIGMEYCSHKEPCGIYVPTCYCTKQLDGLRHIRDLMEEDDA